MGVCPPDCCHSFVGCRPQWAIYTAVYLCHQYFAKRSFQRSDKYVSWFLYNMPVSPDLRVYATVACKQKCAGSMQRLGASPLLLHPLHSSSCCLSSWLMERRGHIQALLPELFSAVCCAVLCCAVRAVLPQLVAVACLYLGSKVQESPKYLRDVIKIAETRKWAKWCDDHPTERRKWEDMVRGEALAQGPCQL